MHITWELVTLEDRGDHSLLINNVLPYHHGILLQLVDIQKEILIYRLAGTYALVEQNRDFLRSEYFRDRKKNIIQAYVLNFKNGKTI